VRETVKAFSPVVQVWGADQGCHGRERTHVIAKVFVTPDRERIFPMRCHIARAAALPHAPRTLAGVQVHDPLILVLARSHSFCA
jgi:hypothetical protein